MGSLVVGRVVAIFNWGVIVDIGLSKVGLIDALYVDDEDKYEPGAEVAAYLESLDSMKDKYILRPPHQTSLAERLRNKGYDV
ncbi:S1 domain-containing protein [Streptomyces triticirhizae]|uniref:S1 motif domain-containing protein n=1 Tax=Streptomyces triticirhizae TaxID=2483353 RepID=A0A3M2M6R8_9ACTN|nr:hypothetical protein [Streptomyces triticirhizae]RMI45212.1 hypothetical protein EBN88_03485 [Streptomyces triticirhizae]